MERHEDRYGHEETEAEVCQDDRHQAEVGDDDSHHQQEHQHPLGDGPNRSIAHPLEPLEGSKGERHHQGEGDPRTGRDHSDLRFSRVPEGHRHRGTNRARDAPQQEG